MGELLQFPGAESRGPTTRTPSTRPAGESFAGAGRRPAAPGDEAEEPPRWAVPVVGVEEPAAPRVDPADGDRGARRAANVAMAALARHDASEGEVRARLAAKGLDDDDVEAELERLRTAGLLDDAAFAARLVSSLRQRKGLGDVAIRSALRTRLVPPAIVDAVLAERVEDEETLHDRVQAVADDRARRLTSLPYEVAERRLTAYLLRKGHGGSAVRTAVRTALDTAGLR